MGETGRGWFCWAGADVVGGGEGLRDAREEEGTVTGSQLVSLQTSFKKPRRKDLCCRGVGWGGLCLVHSGPVGPARAAPPLDPPTDRGASGPPKGPGWP